MVSSIRLIDFEERFEGAPFRYKKIFLRFACERLKNFYRIDKRVVFKVFSGVCERDHTIIGSCFNFDFKEFSQIELYFIENFSFTENLDTILHELAHITYPGHNADFKELLTEYKLELPTFSVSLMEADMLENFRIVVNFKKNKEGLQEAKELFKNVSSSYNKIQEDSCYYFIDLFYGERYKLKNSSACIVEREIKNDWEFYNILQNLQVI